MGTLTAWGIKDGVEKLIFSMVADCPQSRANMLKTAIQNRYTITRVTRTTSFPFWTNEDITSEFLSE